MMNYMQEIYDFFDAVEVNPLLKYKYLEAHNHVCSITIFSWSLTTKQMMKVSASIWQ